MRRLARFTAGLIEGGVAVVDAVGGLAAGGLRRLAAVGEGGDPAGGAEARPGAEPEAKA